MITHVEREYHNACSEHTSNEILRMRLLVISKMTVIMTESISLERDHSDLTRVLSLLPPLNTSMCEQYMRKLTRRYRLIRSTTLFPFKVLIAVSSDLSSAHPRRLGRVLSPTDSCQVRPLRLVPQTEGTRGRIRGRPRTKYSRMPLFSNRKIAHNFYSL